MRNGAFKAFGKGEKKYADELGFFRVIAGRVRVFSIAPNGKEITIFYMTSDECCILSTSFMSRNIQDEVMFEFMQDSEILGKKAYANLQEAFSQNAKIDILNIFRKSEALEGIAKEIIALENKPKCVWVQLGLSNECAKEILTNAGIFYEENSCIKIEHKRLLG